VSQQGEIHACLVAYNLSDGSPELDGAVFDADRRQVPGGVFEVVERTITGISGLDKFLIRFRPDGLEVGEYTVRLSLDDAELGSIHASAVPITVLN